MNNFNAIRITFHLDTISIGVAGYPEQHPTSKSLDEDLFYLKQKVDAGADFIITQICYSSEKIMEFIRNCRKFNISVPILVGLFVPDNIKPIDFISQITNIHMNPEEYRKLKELSNIPQHFSDFLIQKTVNIIQTILASDLNIYGFQFFTLNKFQNVRKVITELCK